jgi:peptidoglycan hydrolase-like protein with peptidoglycan-binding domain
MRLTVNDTGDAVKGLQRGLNKLGSLLVVDGQFGSGTQDAIVAACPAVPNKKSVLVATVDVAGGDGYPARP